MEICLMEESSLLTRYTSVSFRCLHSLPESQILAIDLWWLSGKESACYAGDAGSISGSGRSSGEGNSNLLLYFCLGNLMNRRAWQAVIRSQKGDTT